jgi:hypothetical protein
MGPLPNYFGYFTATCKANPSVSFIVINDHISKSYTDENIKFIKMDLAELNAYSSKQLNKTIQLASAWKINELKPLFGHLFADEFKNYDHWGWCDLDIIWGNLRHFLTEEVLSDYDVITTREHWSTGHFTLFKNHELCNGLYQRNREIIELLNDPTYYAFEECCHRWNGELFSFEALREKKLPVSMYDIIRNAESNHELKAHFKHIIREYPQAINYRYANGVLVDLGDGQEFMYYHLIVVKKIWRFYIPEHKEVCHSLKITGYGIRCENENKLLWFIRRAYSCYIGIKKSAKKQPITQLAAKLFRIRKTIVQ